MENYKTLELVNQFYFKGSILEFYQGTLYWQFIRKLKQRRFEPRKSTGSEAFSIAMCFKFKSLLSQPEVKYFLY